MLEYIEFENHALNETREGEGLPDLKNIHIVTKGKGLRFRIEKYLNDVSKIIKVEVEGKRDLEFWGSYYQCYSEEVKVSKPFIFIYVPQKDGWVVSDQIYYYEPKKNLKDLLRDLCGEEKDDREGRELAEIKPHLERIFPKKYEIVQQPPLDDTRRITPGSKKTIAERDRLGLRSNTYIKPDFLLINLQKNGTQSYIEYERGLRNELAFFIKLWKIHSKTVKIFFIFSNEYVAFHHLEMIAKFEREYNRKFTCLYFCTMDELKFTIWKEKDFHKYPNIPYTQK